MHKKIKTLIFNLIFYIRSDYKSQMRTKQRYFQIYESKRKIEVHKNTVQ